jgi:hypothetical protein
MIHKATLALAAMLVLGSLATARAEDPDADALGRSHSAVEHASPGSSHHAARFSDDERPR